MLDLNEANDQRPDGIIPDGTYVKLLAHIRPGGYDGRDAIDKGLLTQSKNNLDVRMLDFEFTILEGPFAKRKFWQTMVVEGGKTDENGRSKAALITKDTLKAIVNSAAGVDPQDMSDAAKQKRVLNGFAELEGRIFVARVQVEDGGDYPDKNRIDRVVVPGEAEYVPVMQGQEVPAKPRGRTTTKRASAASATPAPAWQQPSLLPNAAGGGSSAWNHTSTTAPAAPYLPNGAGAPVPQPPTAVPATADGPDWLRQ